MRYPFFSGHDRQPASCTAFAITYYISASDNTQQDAISKITAKISLHLQLNEIPVSDYH
ncbi:hypothetical protein [Cesiribacter andamanensis]|uniref:Uncharacterized protein n=1 Tax=Cesiribacter andamanensis AMV16 TaxID=1279009 RepID=M7N5P2_9BACT|nr:hypothetical protein [Cesiribacter andamanensis]EMR02551.1 hypothetical protein ADICEAN_02303 [Cesiribacter andamanensis AMV16]